MGRLSQEDYEERKARQEQGLASDDDLRMIKHYEKREGYSCRGNSSPPSDSGSEKRTKPSGTSRQPTARTTAPPSKRGTGSSTARSTGGRGKAGS